MKLSFLLHPEFHSMLVIFIVLSFLSLSGSSALAETSIPLPDSENRSFIVGVKAGIIDGKTARKEASARLAKRGKQIAIEKIQARLAGKKGADLDFEFAKTPASPAKILKQEELSTPDSSKKPFLWIEAEGTFILKNPRTGKRPEAATLDRADFLDVRIWTDQREYKNAEKIVLYLQGNRDFQGKIIKIDPKGNVHQILPNNYRQLSFFEKGKRYLIPDEGDRYGLSAQPPFGTVRFVVYATSLPLSQVNLTAITGGIFKYRGSEKFFGRSVRHIIPSGEEQLAEFYEARWEIKTVPRK
ncbi:MAG: DUF4384 domain-containing protein [Syntrophobacterales bacterium]|nr:DUF4384 domain-containing protein [Syntrophobacterales bacterium]